MENNLEHFAKSKIEDSDKPVLITGGAGFIGSYLTEYLQQLKIPVLVLDNLSTGTLTNLPSTVIKSSFVLGDVADYRLVKSIVNNCSMVIHLACSGNESGFSQSIGSCRYKYQRHKDTCRGMFRE